MPEECAAAIYPLVDELMSELRNGVGSTALAASLVRRLKGFGAQVTVFCERDRKAVILHWEGGGHLAQELSAAAVGECA